MQQESTPRSNQSRTEATRSALLDVARQMFAETGFAATSTPEIVKAAGVTRGALYHHFADKEALFRAVVAREYQAVAAEIAATLVVGDPIAELLEGSRRYFRAMRQPGRVRIMLIDGPAVLGQAALAEMDQASSAATLSDGLAAAIQSGALRRLPLEAMTLLLSAMFDKAALAVATGANEADVMAVIEALLRGLKA